MVGLQELPEGGPTIQQLFDTHAHIIWKNAREHPTFTGSNLPENDREDAREQQGFLTTNLLLITVFESNYFFKIVSQPRGTTNDFCCASCRALIGTLPHCSGRGETVLW